MVEYHNYEEATIISCNILGDVIDKGIIHRDGDYTYICNNLKQRGKTLPDNHLYGFKYSYCVCDTRDWYAFGITDVEVKFTGDYNTDDQDLSIIEVKPKQHRESPIPISFEWYGKEYTENSIGGIDIGITENITRLIYDSGKFNDRFDGFDEFKDDFNGDILEEIVITYDTAGSAYSGDEWYYFSIDELNLSKALKKYQISLKKYQIGILISLWMI